MPASNFLINQINLPPVSREVDDTFDFSGINTDDETDTSGLLIDYFEVDSPTSSESEADIRFFFGDPDDVPLGYTPTDTTFDYDFIA